MAAETTTINTRINAEDKKDLPFNVESNPFYSPANLDRLDKAFKEAAEGKFTQHELLEIEDK